MANAEKCRAASRGDRPRLVAEAGIRLGAITVGLRSGPSRRAGPHRNLRLSSLQGLQGRCRACE